MFNKLFGRKGSGFDWRKVPGIDPDEVDRWMGVTDAKDRQFPLQLALQVHDEYEWLLMGPQALSVDQVWEIRGGLKALSRFATLYAEIMNAKPRREDA